VHAVLPMGAAAGRQDGAVALNLLPWQVGFLDFGYHSWAVGGKGSRKTLLSMRILDVDGHYFTPAGSTIPQQDNAHKLRHQHKKQARDRELARSGRREKKREKERGEGEREEGEGRKEADACARVRRSEVAEVERS
jgi:hypothetical protein